MMLAAAAVVLAVLFFVFYARAKKKAIGAVVRDTTPALDRWLREVLEIELAEGALGMRVSTPEERKKLARTLADEPDADIVGTIEETVKAVELEFVRYSHETDVETTVRVRYEDGRTGTSTRRMPLSDVPDAVRADFDRKGSTRVFRTWAFPWQRIHAL